jgi:transcriptional regulator with XRE-family HTH domain
MSAQAVPRGRAATGTWLTFVYRRMALKMNQRQAAEYFSVSQPTISAWENKSRAPELEYVPRLAEFLGKTRTEVMDDLSENFFPGNI